MLRKSFQLFLSVRKKQTNAMEENVRWQNFRKSIPSKDGYAITSQNETNIKIIYFNPEHQWIRTQYFSKSGPKKVLLGMEAVDEKNVLFKEWDNKTNSYNTSILSAITLHETKGFLPIAPKAICYTDHGELLFYSDEQIAYYHKFMDKAKSQDKSLPPKSKSGLDKNNESITQINENFSKEKNYPTLITSTLDKYQRKIFAKDMDVHIQIPGVQYTREHIKMIKRMDLEYHTTTMVMCPM